MLSTRLVFSSLELFDSSDEKPGHPPVQVQAQQLRKCRFQMWQGATDLPTTPRIFLGVYSQARLINPLLNRQRAQSWFGNEAQARTHFSQLVWRCMGRGRHNVSYRIVNKERRIGFFPRLKPSSISHWTCNHRLGLDTTTLSSIRAVSLKMRDKALYPVEYCTETHSWWNNADARLALIFFASEQQKCLGSNLSHYLSCPSVLSAWMQRGICPHIYLSASCVYVWNRALTFLSRAALLFSFVAVFSFAPLASCTTRLAAFANTPAALR
jgi:hypothetical protein